jgi:predicted MFS family arabinose efflux permease
MLQIVENRHSRMAQPIPWRATLSGLCASFVGIGIARFAYTPLLPAIIAAHWFTAEAATYLGAANLAGYMAGAALANRLATRAPAPLVIRTMLALAVAAFFACAWPINLAWFFAWRFISGLSGGVVMVLAATTILPHVPPARRGAATGAIFMGVGLGIATSGTLVPLLLQLGLQQAWIGLGVLGTVMTAIAWNGLPAAHPATAVRSPVRHPLDIGWPLKALYFEYALNAVGLVPHMIFLVDFVTRGLHAGLARGAEYWVLFGLGAVLGPILGGHVADRTGFGPALRLGFLVQAAAIAVPALGFDGVCLMVSAVVVGAFIPGVVTLTLGRVREVLEHYPSAHADAWSKATTSFAVIQAGAAYGMSFLFASNGGNYGMLFAIGAAAVVLALATDILAAVIFGRKAQTSA